MIKQFDWIDLIIYHTFYKIYYFISFKGGGGGVQSSIKFILIIETTCLPYSPIILHRIISLRRFINILLNWITCLFQMRLTFFNEQMYLTLIFDMKSINSWFIYFLKFSCISKYFVFNPVFLYLTVLFY